MDIKTFTRSDDVYADAEALTVMYDLHDVGRLAEILLGLEEADYGHTGPIDTKVFVRSTDGIETAEAIERIKDAAELIAAADVTNFSGYMELAIADAFGPASARTIAFGLRAVAEAPPRDLPLAMCPELALLLADPLIEHWQDGGRPLLVDSVALFVRDCLAGRWHMPERFMWPAIEQAALERGWPMTELPTDNLFEA